MKELFLNVKIYHEILMDYFLKYETIVNSTCVKFLGRVFDREVFKREAIREKISILQ